MKYYTLVLSTVAACFLLTQPLAALENGEVSPDFALTGENGKAVRLSDHAGKIIYLDFWASWCATCANSLKWMEGLQQKYGDQNFQVITVNVDENQSDAMAMLKKTGANILVGFDPEGTTPSTYQVDAMPSSYLIGKNGKIIAVHKGLNTSEMRSIESSIRDSLKEQ
jgi:peroxiredoxin